MIEVEHIYKSVGAQQILCDVNFHVDDAEVFALIGRSGSGKTVLMKHLVGLMEPDSGRVLIDDLDLHQASREQVQSLRRKFGVLFQQGALFDDLTIFENTAFPLRMLTDLTEDDIEHRVGECLEMVDLSSSGAKLPADLSGGERKRAAMARAVVLEPRYLFYDEPDSGLDPQTARHIDGHIKQLAKRLNMTSIVVTHNMHTVLSIADRVAYLQNGTLQFVGTVDELRTSDDPELLSFLKSSEYHVEP